MPQCIEDARKSSLEKKKKTRSHTKDEKDQEPTLSGGLARPAANKGTTCRILIIFSSCTYLIVPYVFKIDIVLLAMINSMHVTICIQISMQSSKVDSCSLVDDVWRLHSL